MMALCRKPVFSFTSSLKRIQDSKKDQKVKDVVDQNKGILKSQVAKYVVNRRRLEAVSSYGFYGETKEKLADCYEKMPVKLSEDVVKVHKAVLRRAYICPYCMLSEPDSSDHYLPQESFPEFSFFIYNLIPSCTNCNRRKGKRWVDNGVRLFVNPYFDDVSHRAIDVQLSLKREVLEFYSIAKDPVFSSHIEKLGLLDRYERAGGSVLEKVMMALVEAPDLYEQEFFKDEMGRQYRINKNIYGENHYETVIYRRLWIDGHDLN